MKERLTYERFELNLPARLEMATSVKMEIFDTQTMDISVAGAFLSTKEQFPEGTKFQLELTIPSNRIKELTGSQSYIEVKGVVVRSSPGGVAIYFDGDCRILNLKGS